VQITVLGSRLAEPEISEDRELLRSIWLAAIDRQTPR
jgi:hypothetical protein